MVSSVKGKTMNSAIHNKLISFIWSIADDCLRDVYVRGKYRDVILPMVVLRRLDALLEPTKAKVMEEINFQRDEAGFTEWDDVGLRDASGYVFYNTSEWTLQRLYDTAINNQQILQANVEDYLNGFSTNVKEIIEKFKLKRQIRHMASKDVLLDVLEKFTSPYINLTPFDKNDPEGRKMPALTNLGMGSMTINEHIQHWIDSAENDLETANILFNSKRYDWCLFISHLVKKRLSLF